MNYSKKAIQIRNEIAELKKFKYQFLQRSLSVYSETMRWYDKLGPKRVEEFRKRHKMPLGKYRLYHLYAHDVFLKIISKGKKSGGF